MLLSGKAGNPELRSGRQATGFSSKLTMIWTTKKIEKETLVRVFVKLSPSSFTVFFFLQKCQMVGYIIYYPKIYAKWSSVDITSQLGQLNGTNTKSTTHQVFFAQDFWRRRRKETLMRQVAILGWHQVRSGLTTTPNQRSRHRESTLCKTTVNRFPVFVVGNQSPCVPVAGGCLIDKKRNIFFFTK